MFNPNMALIDGINFAADAVLQGLQVADLDQLLAVRRRHAQPQNQGAHFLLS
jgi:hypothetical protein